MDNGKVTLGQASYILSELIKRKYLYHGQLVESYSPASELIFGKLYGEEGKINQYKKRLLLHLLYDHQYRKLEAELDKLTN